MIIMKTSIMFLIAQILFNPPENINPKLTSNKNCFKIFNHFSKNAFKK